ncbi:PrgI family protein (plasmid) [Aneurinibacillus sp. Ricciae_BoGa-3]|uniref:PrgI family protein n=1 Tax=Aneurinibacillus sp. Ricciae_BoGa-3 TaxID=3022697 RepID=UPI0023421104|nr:PrgI family protein [Aneurinibacillus sp. Ricciae_BoGa-3]WCK56942.1 PrgI family protein [Aneurinibacillus sp. Ricciae_BoGa-3]WCK57765.1 PrgI family protein [Aneurinibacillus sp. Ricciae_BoGa-3]
MASKTEAVGTFSMRVYNIPPNMNEKEKVIGGILNLNQFFWVLGGLALGASVFGIIYSLTKIGGLALTMGGLFCLSGAPFALYKKHGLTLFQYLTRKRRFKKKTQKLPNMRKEVKL